MKRLNLPPIEEFRKLVHAALRQWHNPSIDESNGLLSLLLVKKELLKASVNTQAKARLAVNSVIFQALEELKKMDSKSSHVLIKRFVEDEQITDIARIIHTSESTVSRIQSRGLVSLGKILLDQELAERNIKIQYQESLLPPPSYVQLFGLDETVPRLKKQLLNDDGPNVISLVGMGGIGKTSLADCIAREIISEFYFDRIVWVRSDPQTMTGWIANPQLSFQSIVRELSSAFDIDKNMQSHIEHLTFLRQNLKSQKCLIVIDNLETQEDMAYLMDEISNLANPSKFLITSRTRSLMSPSIYSFSVPALGQDDAIALLKQQIMISSIPKLADEDFETIFEAIYNAVGGSPLSLKLVAGLLDFLSLDQILQSLVTVSSSAIESLYIRIYWQAWQVLTAPAKSLLLAMPLVGASGAPAEFLRAVSDLPEAEFWPALQELRNRSLVEVRGNIHKKRYGIHRLTKSFLYSEVINWSSPRSKHT